MAWHGAYYGFPNVEKYAKNWQQLEYIDDLNKLADELYQETTTMTTMPSQQEINNKE